MCVHGLVAALLMIIYCLFNVDEPDYPLAPSMGEPDHPLAPSMGELAATYACPCFGPYITSVHERVHTSNTIAIAKG